MINVLKQTFWFSIKVLNQVTTFSAKKEHMFNNLRNFSKNAIIKQMISANKTFLLYHRKQNLFCFLQNNIRNDKFLHPFHVVILLLRRWPHRIFEACLDCSWSASQPAKSSENKSVGQWIEMFQRPKLNSIKQTFTATFNDSKDSSKKK